MRFPALALAVVCLCAGAFADQEPELIPFWDVSDETNGAMIDHTPWQALLATYLAPHPSGVNRFDYAALKAEADDLARLNTYLCC